MNRPMTKQEWLSYIEQTWNAIEKTAQRTALPDAITDDSESPEYRTGWNECREVMKGMMK